MIRLIVVRHGRTALNTGEGMDERFRGTIDAPLAPDGLEQARATGLLQACLLYTSPSPRDRTSSRMPSSACKKKQPQLYRIRK